MSAATVNRRVQRFLLAGLGFLLAWQIAALAGAPRGVRLALALQGFVFHVVFAKAYALVPSYFARELEVAWAPAVQLPLTAVGALGLAAAAGGAPAPAGRAGAALWFLGAVVFVGALAWTLRGNLAGRETGTGEANAERRGVDRYANAFVPVVLLYLLAGAYDVLAGHATLPSLAGGGAPTSHLLAAGVGALLVLSVGYRLFPRLLVVAAPRPLVLATLPAAAVAPVLLAGRFLAGPAFVVGAALEAVAVVGFAGAMATMFRRSDRRRVGGYAALAGAAAGTAGVALGVDFALRGPTAALAAAHVRLNLLGFLGLTIVGAAYHFYPPGAGQFRLAGDRTAAATVWLLAGGLAVEVLGLVAGLPPAVLVGRLAALTGAGGFVYLVGGLLGQQRRRRRG